MAALGDSDLGKRGYVAQVSVMRLARGRWSPQRCRASFGVPPDLLGLLNRRLSLRVVPSECDLCTPRCSRLWPSLRSSSLGDESVVDLTSSLHPHNFFSCLPRVSPLTPSSRPVFA